MVLRTTDSSTVPSAAWMLTPCPTFCSMSERVTLPLDCADGSQSAPVGVQ